MTHQITEANIIFECGKFPLHYWVLEMPKNVGYQVLQSGATHSTVVRTFKSNGNRPKVLSDAIAACKVMANHLDFSIEGAKLSYDTFSDYPTLSLAFSNGKGYEWRSAKNCCSVDRNYHRDCRYVRFFGDLYVKEVSKVLLLS